eukprot:scaffold190068_cov31-Tisochrysis_lutea.AAC.1
MQGEAQLKCLICESSNDASGGALPSLLHLCCDEHRALSSPQLLPATAGNRGTVRGIDGERERVKEAHGKGHSRPSPHSRAGRKECITAIAGAVRCACSHDALMLNRVLELAFCYCAKKNS